MERHCIYIESVHNVIADALSRLDSVNYESKRMVLNQNRSKLPNLRQLPPSSLMSIELVHP